MAKSARQGGDVGGPQQHAEGQHGEKTHERFREQISEFRDAPDPTEPEGIPHREGKHRLDEDRQQHDEAERDSELTKEDSRNARSDSRR
jgi:hypothetical protein